MFNGGFTDGNDQAVKAGDRVEYRFGARHGRLIDAMHDGDAWVEFDDNPNVAETVKWYHLCKLTETK